MTTLRIERLARYPDPAWNAYVDGHPLGSVFHLSEWACVYAGLRWVEPHFLLARHEGAIVGLMPLARVCWQPRASALVAAPYCVEAGAIADDEDTRAALENAALACAHELEVAHLEIRQIGTPNPDWGCYEGFAGFGRALADNDESNLAAVPRKQRAVIRKAEAGDLAVDETLGLDEFYPLYATSVRDLGTPAYPRLLFELLARAFGSRLGFFGVRDAGGPVVAVMSFYYKGRVMPYYAGGLPRARAAKAYDFLYWRLMCEAVQRGCDFFDFGRSIVGSGAWSYKKNWGFAPRTMCYQFVPVNAAAATPLDPDTPFNHAARRAWSHLPLAIANRLGPWLARRLY